jgi:hypothetical protein
MFWLLHRFPGEFSLKVVSRSDPGQDEPEPELPLEIVRRYRELAREDELLLFDETAPEMDTS